jgi:3-oxoacyl-[acyl-carrier-protein] synthase-3
MFHNFKGIGIQAISACVPKQVVDNEFFSHIITSDEIRKFERITGILERRYASNEVTSADLAFHAAMDVLSNGIETSDIKALIFVSQTSDYKIPFTSNILQDRLNLKKEILCIDINAGCAGFVQGLSTAFALANSLNGNVLFIVAETLSKILSSRDRVTSTLFGDGAAALILGKFGYKSKKSAFNFFSDGKNFDAILIPEGGYRKPFSQESLIWRLDEYGNSKNGLHLHMDGQRVFDFTLREIPKSIQSLLDDSNNLVNDIDYFLFHQSNKFIITQIASRLGIPIEKLLLNIHRFGNTSGVSIPLLIVTELKGKIIGTRKLLFSGYGSGLSWGNCILDFNDKIIINDLIEL